MRVREVVAYTLFGVGALSGIIAAFNSNNERLVIGFGWTTAFLWLSAIVAIPKKD